MEILSLNGGKTDPPDIIFILILAILYLVGKEKLILKEFFHSYFAGLTEELRKNLFL